MSFHSTDAISEVATYENRVKQERVCRGENETERENRQNREKPVGVKQAAVDIVVFGAL